MHIASVLIFFMFLHWKQNHSHLSSILSIKITEKLYQTRERERERKAIFSLIKFVQKNWLDLTFLFTQTSVFVYFIHVHMRNRIGGTACECVCTEFVDCVSHASKYQISFAHFRLSHVFFIFMCVCALFFSHHHERLLACFFYEALLVFFFLDWRLINSKRWFCCCCCCCCWVTPFKDKFHYWQKIKFYRFFLLLLEMWSTTTTREEKIMLKISSYWKFNTYWYNINKKKSRDTLAHTMNKRFYELNDLSAITATVAATAVNMVGFL